MWTIAGITAGWLAAEVLLGHSEPPLFTLVICPVIFVVWPVSVQWLNLGDEVVRPTLRVANALLYGLLAHSVVRGLSWRRT
jgi:hypothetical protein